MDFKVIKFNTTSQANTSRWDFIIIIYFYFLNLKYVYNYIIAAPPLQNKGPLKWDIIAVAPWTDAGAVDENHVISSKRQRKNVHGNV